MKVRHSAEIIIGDYQFAESLNEEVLHQLQFAENIGHTNVKASLHTEWDWLPDNQKIKNFKSFITSEIENHFKPGDQTGDKREYGRITAFWGNVYRKGDCAEKHNHTPCQYSFSYFVKSKWYDSPLVFNVGGEKVRPKEGRYIIFPSYLIHSVPKHRYDHDRITLSGNYRLKLSNAR